MSQLWRLWLSGNSVWPSLPAFRNSSWTGCNLRRMRCMADLSSSSRPHPTSKALTTLSQKSATVAENGQTTATVAEFGDSPTFLRQCGQALTRSLHWRRVPERISFQLVVLMYGHQLFDVWTPNCDFTKPVFFRFCCTMPTHGPVGKIRRLQSFHMGGQR